MVIWRMLPIWMALFLAAPEDEKNRDFFFSTGDQKVFLEISPDVIGVASQDNQVRRPVAAGRPPEFATPLGLQVERDFPNGNLVLLRAPKPLDRRGLVKLAQDVRQSGREVVDQVGFVVRARGSDTPLVVTDEFIVRFTPGTTRQQIDELNQSNGVQVVMQNPFIKDQYVLRVTGASPADALEISNRYHEMKERVVYAHPDFIIPTESRQTIPKDPLFGDQWHHQNTGQSAGTVDADVDTPLAWDLTQGAPQTLIAIIDDGFDMTHEDLLPNLWTNTGEIAGNGADDDGNGFIDDVRGWDFSSCRSTRIGCGDNNPATDNTNNLSQVHGTVVAGLAAGRGNNDIGITGTCPSCRLMLLRKPTIANVSRYGMAFGYAQHMGAQIINGSWGFPLNTPQINSLVDALNEATTNGRGGLGSVVFLAMNNQHNNDCGDKPGGNPDLSSLSNVIGVSSATNRDRFDLSGHGTCMDVLAPSAYTVSDKPSTTVASGRGTLLLTSTDQTGPNGFNAGPNAKFLNCPSTDFTPAAGDNSPMNYTRCFMGTSAATPITSGVAGLILTANPGLTRLQVQQLLQDTADKIEDSAGAYSPVNGFSGPASHGWGRVNAFEAVRVATPVAQGGRGGVDIFFRDNRLDWGNTEQPSNTLFEATRGSIGHWESTDIKVDAPPFQTPPTAETFEAFVDETPSARAGDTNRVYVRVRNRGPTPAASVTVKLLWSQFGTTLATLPGDFWTAFPGNSADTSQWNPLNCAGSATPSCTITQLAYSGSSVAGTSTDAARIVQFDFPAPAVDPNKPNHFCLLALADSPEDGIATSSKAGFVVDAITPSDNNITHRNYLNLIAASPRTRSFTVPFFVRNPLDKPARFVLRPQAPRGWAVSLDQFALDKPFTVEPGKEVLVRARIRRPAGGQNGQVSIFQEQADPQAPKLVGGFSVGISTRRK